MLLYICPNRECKLWTLDADDMSKISSSVVKKVPLQCGMLIVGEDVYVSKGYMGTLCTFHSIFYEPKTVLKTKFLN